MLVGKGGGVHELDARGNVVIVHPAATPEPTATARPVARRDEATAPPRQIALPGRAALHTLPASHLVLALDAGDACQIAWLDEKTDALHLSPPLRIAPPALRFLCATDAAALLGVDLGAREIVLRVGLERGEGRRPAEP